MGSFVTNRGAYLTATGQLNWIAGTYKIMLLKTTYVFDHDHDFVSDITSGTSKELVATNYTGGFGGSGRKTLANKTITNNTTDDQIDFDADNVTWASLGAVGGGAGNDTIGGAAIIREVTNDSDSDYVAFLDPADIVTTGIDFLLTFPANYVFFIDTNP